MRFQVRSPNILEQSDTWFSTFPQNSYLLISVAAVPAEGSKRCLSHCESILREASLNYHWGTEGCIFQEFGRPQQEATTGLWQKITFQQHRQFQRPPHLPPAAPPPTAAVLWQAVAVCLPLKGKCIPPSLPPAETPPGISAPELGVSSHLEKLREEKKEVGGGEGQLWQQTWTLLFNTSQISHMLFCKSGSLIWGL